MLTEATQQLIAAAGNPSASEADIKAAAQAFFNGVTRSSQTEANQALVALAGALAMDHMPGAGFLALVCGALIEQGCDPAPLAGPLGRLLQPMLEGAAALADACRAPLPQSGAANEDAGLAHDDPGTAFDAAMQTIGPTMPREQAAWKALDNFWRPAILVLSVNPAARASARGLKDLAAKIADHHQGGHWLRLMLSVLDDEPILAIEPATGHGILGKISGVVDNFQLNVLLMDAFPKAGFFARRRVSRQVADVARGVGPQQSDDIVTSVWNLYTWRAIQPGLNLPDPGNYSANACWIWNEGSPEDIPVFEGRRVVLLGPHSYPRSWQSQRLFDKLPAKLEVDGQLRKDEVQAWLRKMADAKDRK